MIDDTLKCKVFTDIVEAFKNSKSEEPLLIRFFVRKTGLVISIHETKPTRHAVIAIIECVNKFQYSLNGGGYELLDYIFPAITSTNITRGFLISKSDNNRLVLQDIATDRCYRSIYYLNYTGV